MERASRVAGTPPKGRSGRAGSTTMRPLGLSRKQWVVRPDAVGNVRAPGFDTSGRRLGCQRELRDRLLPWLTRDYFGTAPSPSLRRHRAISRITSPCVDATAVHSRDRAPMWGGSLGSKTHMRSPCRVRRGSSAARRTSRPASPHGRRPKVAPTASHGGTERDGRAATDVGAGPDERGHGHHQNDAGWRRLGAASCELVRPQPFWAAGDA